MTYTVRLGAAIALGAATLLGASIVGLPASFAHAPAPYAGVIETADASYEIRARDGTRHVVEIYVYRDRPFLGEDAGTVSVSITSCIRNVCRGDSWHKQIHPDEFAVDERGNWATLETTFARAPLRASWRGCDCFYGTTYVGASGVSDHWGGEAVATISLWGLRCRGPGMVDRETRVDTMSSPARIDGSREPRERPPPFDRPGVVCAA